LKPIPTTIKANPAVDKNEVLPNAGFIGKFYVVWAAISNGMWLMAFVLVISSVIGLYYYLRVIKTMLSTPENNSTERWIKKPSRLGFIVLSVLCIFTILLGVFPSPLINLIQSVSLNF